MILHFEAMEIKVAGSVYVAVSRARGVPPPLGDGCGFSFLLFILGVGWVGLLSQKKKEIKVAEEAEDAHVERVRFRQSTGCLGRSPP